jgi:ribosomal protein L33
VGFDHVDKKFAPKKPIKLECEDCGSTKDVRTIDCVPSHLLGAPDEHALCKDCRVYFYMNHKRKGKGP